MAFTGVFGVVGPGEFVLGLQGVQPDPLLQVVTTTINLSQMATPGFYDQVVTTTMNLSQTAEGESNVQFVSNTLNLQSTASANKEYTRSATTTIGLTQHASPGFYDAEITTTISLVQSVGFGALVTHNVGLTQTVTVVRDKDTKHFLQLTQTVSRQVLLNRSATSTLSLQQFVLAEVTGSNCLYTPAGFGAGTPSLTPGNVSLTDGDSTITVRGPNFGDRERLDFARINRSTRGGTLIIYSDPNWPNIQTLEYAFSNLSREQALALRAFLQTTCGQEVVLTDHYGRGWDVVITNPDAEISQQGRGCQYAVTLQFEGTLQ